MLAAKLLAAAIALGLHAAAIPGSSQASRGSGLHAKADTCDADFSILVVNGPCKVGHKTCEFCCPDSYNVPVETHLDHCHFGHEPWECEADYVEWHCLDHDDDHHEEQRTCMNDFWHPAPLVNAVTNPVNELNMRLQGWEEAHEEQTSG